MPSARLDGDAVREWRAHWQVVLAGTLGVAGSTLNTYSVGLFMAPLQRAFGWSRAEITAGLVIPAVLSVATAVPVGRLVDRIGPRRIGIPGIAILCLATALLGLTGGSIWDWWAIWCLLGAINSLILPMVWTAGITQFFSAARGSALAVALCGSGIASLVIPVLTYRLIAGLGWRGAYAGLALACALAVLPVLFLCLTSRADLARREGRVPRAATPAAAAASRRALLSRSFLLLTAAALLIATVTVSFAVNMVPVLTSEGIGRGQAAGIASTLGLSAIAGRLVIGVLLDRLDGRLLAAISVSLPVLSSAILIGAPASSGSALAAALIVGLALGTELDLVAYLASRHFSLESFGLLFGTIGAGIAVAGSVGPWLASLVYDRSHSYSAALWAAIPLCLLAALSFLSLGPYPAEPSGSRPA